jgi:hypothetical protein
MPDRICVVPTGLHPGIAVPYFLLALALNVEGVDRDDFQQLHQRDPDVSIAAKGISDKGRLCLPDKRGAF